MKKTKKQIVFETAAELFMEKGYLAASMRELAERVGLEQASSLYNHLKSKEEVLRKICLENADKFIAGISSIEQSGATPTEQLKALIRLHVHIATENPTSTTVFNDEWRHLSEPFLSDFLEKRRDYENRFKKIIDIGIESGVFKNIDSTIALYTILSSFRWIHYWYKPGRKVSVEKLEADVFAMLVEGLKG
ncbi:MAG: AcrR family transcriptional regulator [Saprospiraceae bacterium]|jgi:AcrR family transcriptional regulator